MAKKNDIGTLFENKLKEGEKSPNTNLWEKINNSLEKEERKRRKLFFYWLSGAGIIGLISLWGLFSNSFFTATPVVDSSGNSIKTEEMKNTSDSENQKSITSTSLVDSLNSEENKAEKLLELNTFKEDSIQQLEHISDKISKGKTTNTNSKKKKIDESFEVSAKYYYYNSSDGKQIVTENKKTIDSLILAATNKLDSTQIKKKDSL